MDIASALDYQQARGTAVNAVLINTDGAIRVEKEACEGLTYAVAALKNTQRCIKTLLEYYESFIVLAQKLVDHAHAAVKFERKLATALDGLQKSCASMMHAVTSDLNITRDGILHGSSTLDEDTLRLERHWASHTCLFLVLSRTHEAFLDKGRELCIKPARSNHTLTRASLYAENWRMATPTTMRGDSNSYVPACPYFRLTIPQRAMAPHTFKCWWEKTEALEDLTALRVRMINELPPKGDAAVDIETDHEQVTDNEENASQLSDSSEELDTPFPLLSDKMIHIIAYGWDQQLFDDLDIVAALESLMLPLQSRLEPRTVNGVPLVDMILTCLDTYTWCILEQRAAWIKHHDTHVFVAFRISVGSNLP
jgi:hypothetical protein